VDDVQDRPPYHEDFFQRIINVNWGGMVYVIISAAGYNYAVPNPNLAGVKIIDTWSDYLGGGGGGESLIPPVSSTLIECGSNAGDNFVALLTLPTDLLGLADIFVYACPHTDEVKTTWHDYVLSQYDGDFQDANGYPLGPFFWFAHTWAGDEVTMGFKVRSDSGANKIAQAYPISGDSVWSSSDTLYITGWEAIAYRLDKDGTGPIYSAAWMNTDDVLTSAKSGPINLGLKFGKDPPQIGAASSTTFAAVD
jgi:hypothetical protein